MIENVHDRIKAPVDIVAVHLHTDDLSIAVRRFLGLDRADCAGGRINRLSGQLTAVRADQKRKSGCRAALRKPLRIGSGSGLNSSFTAGLIGIIHTGDRILAEELLWAAMPVDLPNGNDKGLQYLFTKRHFTVIHAVLLLMRLKRQGF